MRVGGNTSFFCSGYVTFDYSFHNNKADAWEMMNESKPRKTAPPRGYADIRCPRNCIGSRMPFIISH